jgi:hypothetical protein
VAGKRGSWAPQGRDRTSSQNLQRVRRRGEQRAGAQQQQEPGKGAEGPPPGVTGLVKGPPGEHVKRAATSPSPVAGSGTWARLGGAARSPSVRTGRCHPGCGRGLGRPWPPRGTGPRGRSRSGLVITLPPSPLHTHRGSLGADSTAPPP